MVKGINYGIRIREKCTASLCQCYRPGGSVEEFTVEFCFQGLNLFRYSWLRKAELFSGFHIIEGACEADKAFKLRCCHIVLLGFHNSWLTEKKYLFHLFINNNINSFHST